MKIIRITFFVVLMLIGLYRPAFCGLDDSGVIGFVLIRHLSMLQVTVGNATFQKDDMIEFEYTSLSGENQKALLESDCGTMTYEDMYFHILEPTVFEIELYGPDRDKLEIVPSRCKPTPHSKPIRLR